MIRCPACNEENPDRFRLCGFCGTPLAPALPPQETRKTVTILFSDLKGSTSLGEALDSESLREVMSRYFDAMRGEIEKHGGTIEKYIGDAVMAVFGLPVLHEDDALRAVRAASGMQRALASLNVTLETTWGIRLSNRTGVHTGEVVAGDPATGQRLVTGDPVNTAARLEQAAPADQVLIGELTWHLVRDAVEVEAVEPLELKGKAERVPAYRLLSVRGDQGRVRREDAPIVGREAELVLLRSSFADAVTLPAARLVTVVGDAGVGKSRLIREFVSSVVDRALVLRGRCLPYGDGITFWPLVEVIRAAAGIRDDDLPQAARQKLRGLVADADVSARVASIAGLDPAPFPLPELYWGARRLLELLAAGRPLVVVLDDIHWAEPALLDFLEHVLDAAGPVPILLLCTARHELLESRPAWAEREGAARLVLRPLGQADAGRVVENLLGSAGFPEAVRDRIVASSEGNPLFVEQMLSMLIESGALRLDEGRWVRADEGADILVPPSIQALLAARLDRLARDERSVIEPASVVGLEFAEPAVAELAPDAVRPNVPRHLVGLERRQLVRAEPSGSTGDRGYRFAHILIRDAAYQGMLKRTRAALHERFVAWADRVNAEVDRATEFEEILGYHLEQAYLYMADLGPVDDHGTAVGHDAARRLASAGRRAFARGDMHAAANLLRRAAGVQAARDPARLALIPDLGEALMETGRFDEATALLDDAIAAADDLRDDILGAHASLAQLSVAYHQGGGDDWSGRALRTADEAIRVFERAGDDSGLAKAWRVRFGALVTVGSYGDAARAAEQVMDHARRAGDLRQERRGASSYAQTALYGPIPVDEAIARCESIIERTGDDRRTTGLTLVVLGELYGMRGDSAAARDAYTRGRTMLEALGRSVLAASTSVNSWRVEVLAGDLAGAERELLRDYQLLAEMGERFLLSNVAARLATVLVAADRPAEAAAFATTAEEAAADDDVEAQALWRGARARLLASAGEASEAERLAREAVGLLRATDGRMLLADALADLGDVLLVAGRPHDARLPLAEAIAICDAKGSTACASRIRALLEQADAASG